MNKALLYRMVTNQHICPYGIDLLQKQGYEIEDHHLETREETDKFKEKHNVKTTPQTFINKEKVGGYNDLRVFFGKKSKENNDEKTYEPIIAIFSITFLMAIGTTWLLKTSFDFVKITEFFISFSMCVLAIMKLRDLYSFSNQFITYDLLAKRVVDYAYIYPFVEGLAGVLMIAGVFTWLAAPAALFIATIGAVSVFKAVYIDKRELKCACVGGNSNVPLGIISLIENLMMIGIALWMLIK